MDPQLKSLVTSVGMVLATSVASWAVSKGIIPSGDQSTLTNDIVLVVSTIITALLAWWKTHAVSPKAMINAINTADNGVKVVSESVPGPKVDAPTK